MLAQAEPQSTVTLDTVAIVRHARNCRYKLDTKDAWAHHEGNPADERMTAAAKKRDIHLTSRSRPLKPDDFTNFDYIIGMDHENSKAIKQAAMHWQDDLKRSLPDNWQDKVRRASC